MIYPCDYGHDHRTAQAKRRCEERNDARGTRGARLGQLSPPSPPQQTMPPIEFGKWRAR